MNKGLTFGAGLGLGTGLMYLLDPDRGRRRRALLRDKGALAVRKTGECWNVTTRDLSNRTQGIVSELKSHLSSEPIDDSVLVERVRAKLGRVVSHPSAIQVTVQNGVVTLAGPILSAEAPELLSLVSGLRGVNEVVNNLELHETAENHPALQGGRELQGSRFEFLQENWSPSARLIAGAAGATLAAVAGVRRDALGAGLGAAGLLLLTRGITNIGFKHLVGGRSSNGAITENG
jgi:hypothetical protein